MLNVYFWNVALTHELSWIQCMNLMPITLKLLKHPSFLNLIMLKYTINTKDEPESLIREP